MAYFPLGYNLPESDDEIRHDIFNLFHILSEFKDVDKGYLNKNLVKTPHRVKFPINSYLEIIYYYMENGYYIERDPIFKTDTKGKIDWSKTIKKQRPLLQKNKNEHQENIESLCRLNEKKNALLNIVALKELALHQWNYVQLILIVAKIKLNVGMELVLIA